MTKGETEQNMARFVGFCIGPDSKRKLDTPAFPTLISTDARTILICEFLNPNGTCNALRNIPPSSIQPCRIFGTSVTERIGDSVLTIDTPLGRLEYDPDTREVIKAPLLNAQHERVFLTPIEGIYLTTLMRNHGRVVTYEELNQAACQSDFFPGNKAVTMHISHLRRKVGDSSQ